MENIETKSSPLSKLIWVIVAIIGAVSFGILAVSKGEHVNAVWLVLAAICVYSIAYRFYSLFIANKVFELNPRRLTPAHRLNEVWTMCQPINMFFLVTILLQLQVLDH